MFKVMAFLVASLVTFSGLIAQITGTLLGHDGKSMAAANIVLTKLGSRNPDTAVIADKDGKYCIKASSPGIWMLTFAGVSHNSHQVAIYLDKPAEIHLDVRLQTYEYVDSLDKVGVEGDFNNYNIPNPTPMHRQPDGTYTAEIETKADSIIYELVGITKNGHTINGTQSERTAYDWQGDYWSVLTPSNGKVKIVFDPAKLVRSNEPVKVAFADTQSLAARFATIYGEMQDEQSEFYNAFNNFRKTGKDLGEFKYDWSKSISVIRDRLDSETNELLRQELLLRYLNLSGVGVEVDTNLIMIVLKVDSASSPIWQLDPGLYRYKDPYGFAKSMALFNEFMFARLVIYDSAKALKYYNLLINQYGDMPYGKMAERFSPISRIRVRAHVPAFSIASLEDSTKMFTNESFRGKYYMIDFWATWCGPCVGEMEALHKAYAKFKDKNFVILSVSFDASPQDVLKFRQDKWQMPWLHAFADQGFDSKMAKDFETIGIPHPILVDTAGTIVATEEDLRGESLEKTLEKYLGK
ncbi:MAG TPA: thioredoxin-like domain-containing protein [Candidatus Acidoferrales bacterium]|nr:thioredoxin-like domain-containing protein [Candidatus Acidoferrales bacterium]